MAAGSDDVSLRAATEALLDPQALIEALWDHRGQIVDFVYRAVNPAACDYLGKPADELIGVKLTATLPDMVEAGLLTRYAHCLQTGEPLEMEDLPYFSRRYQTIRRFDLRVAPLGGDHLNLVWRDVTERYEMNQRQLIASEEKFRLIAENSSDVVIQLRDLNIVWISPSVEAALGAPPEYWIGQPAITFVVEEDAAVFAQMVAETDMDATSLRRLRVKDAVGGRHWAEVHARPFHGADGEPDGQIGSLRIIDAQVAAEQDAEAGRRLQAQADARYRDMISNSGVPAALTDLDGRFELVNRAMCDFLGYDPETLRTKTWQEMTAPATLEADLRNAEDLVAGRIDSYRTTKQFIRSDGRLVWGDMTAGCLRDQRGEPEMFIAQVVDVDRDMQARREREEADARYRHLVENSPVATATSHPQGSFTLVNRAFCEFLGYQAEELVGMPWPNVIPPEELPEARQVISEMAAGGRDIFTGIRPYLHADGHHVWGEVTLSCTREPDGGIESIVTQIVDITAETAARAEAEEARRKQERSDALLRRSLESATIGMALTTPDGTFTEVNDAMCRFFGYDADALVGKNGIELTAAVDRASAKANLDDLVAGRIDSYRMRKQYIHADGHIIWGDLSVGCVRDRDGSVETLIAQIVDITSDVRMRDQLERSRRQELLASERYRQLTENSIVPASLSRPDGSLAMVNQAMCDLLGYDADPLLTMTWMDLVAPDCLEEAYRNTQDLLLGRSDSYRGRQELIHADGHRLTVDISMASNRSSRVGVDTVIAQLVDITAEVKAQAELEEAQRVQAITDALYRRSVESAAVGMCLVSPHGFLYQNNQSICDFFGYDQQELMARNWRELTAPECLPAHMENIEILLAGGIDSYEMDTQFINSAGERIWGHLTVSCLRGADGRVETVIGQIIDITEAVLSREKLTQREQQLTSEMASAATYVASLLPEDLHGEVEVSSAYLPSLELGGDCFHYRWIDDDLLKIYMIDVSGHGIRPALLSMSVHNILRSGSLPTSTLLRPERVLGKLNSLFQMDEQDGVYFTMWYGVYETSTRTLRYASGGHPPAMAFNTNGDGRWECTELTGSSSLPLGMFENATFETATYTVPAGCRLMVFSDGVFEIPLPDGEHSSIDDLAEAALDLLDANEFSADAVADRMRSKSIDGQFDDDCSLVIATFE